MMKISLYAHPLAGLAPQVFDVESLPRWLLDQFGPVPTVNLQIFIGEPCSENEISSDVDAILNCTAPEITVLQSPGGLDPITLTIITIVLNVAMSLLAPKPVPPANVNRTQQSPNNALTARENQVRLLQRVEDIYGTVKAIPSLMMPTYNKYIGHQKYEYGYYCVGRGYYTLTEIRDGDTLISDITGAAASVYDPFTSPNGGTPILQIGAAIIDDIITAKRAIEVDGLTLQAPNQVYLPTSAAYSFAVGGVITQPAKTPNFNAVASAGDVLVISMSPTVITSTAADIGASNALSQFYDTALVGCFNHVVPGDVVTMAGFAVPGNNTTWTVAAKPDAWTLTLTAAPAADSAPAVTCAATRDYSGTWTVASVGDGNITVSGSTWPPLVVVTCGIQVAGYSANTDWVTLPDADRTEVWANITAPNGLFKDGGGGKSVATVAFVIEIEQLHATTLVPLGVVETVSSSLSGAVSDERADTIEHATAWTGPARVRMYRVTDYDYAFSGTVQDEIKWADLYSISPVSATQFGNKTTIHTITQATARATAVKTRQLNCIASRLLPTYNGTAFSGAFNAAGLHTSGTISATAKLCDIIAAVSVDPKIGARVLADEIDIAQIWGVQQQLDAWGADYGQFNYTLDTDNTSFEETLVLIANAGFCIAYRQNGKVRLAFDHAQTSSSALFTHRNKKPASETITRKFASDAEYDGVEFVYMDPDSKQAETITLPLDDSATKLKKFEIAGIRNFNQAWRRANREYRKLIGQRLSLETVTTLDARSLLPNARIDVVDNTRFKSYDGEVVGQSGMELTLSRDVAFIPATAHSIVLMRRDGSLQSIACTAGSAPNRVVLASLPSEAIVTQFGPDGIRTIFSFAADSARESMAWLVQELDVSDGQYCTVRAINYSADYFAEDNTTIPARATVIG